MHHQGLVNRYPWKGRIVKAKKIKSSRCWFFYTLTGWPCRHLVQLCRTRVPRG